MVRQHLFLLCAGLLWLGEVIDAGRASRSRRETPEPSWAGTPEPSWADTPETPSERRAVPDPKAAPAKRFNRPKTPSERRAVPDPKAAPAKRATGGKKVDEIKMFDSAGNQVTVSVEDACVEAHNRVRMLHENTPNVTYDAALANQAAEWALHLTTVGDLVHSSGDYGENLFYIGASPSLFGAGELTAACPAHAVYSWYSESWTASEQPYNYASETNPGVTGHFTQVVWKSSTKVGCGVAVVADGGYINTYVVARYTDRGNMGGSYLDNVMPMKAGAQRPSVSGDLDTVPGCAYYGANCGSAQSAGYCQYIKAYCECQCP